MIKIPTEPTGQQFAKANARIARSLDKNKTILVLAIVAANQIIYRFYECSTREKAANIISYYPEVFRKSYTIGDKLPKNIAAEVYHSTKKAVNKLNGTTARNEI
jgi:hypothetical protein